jgi:hypothetical protein
MTWNIGDEVHAVGLFENAGGALIDPTTVSMDVTTPAGVVTTVTPTKDATGVYFSDVTLTESGDWTFRIYSTGTGRAAATATLTVD